MTESMIAMTEGLKQLASDMKSIIGFKIDRDVKSGYETIATLIETGQTDQALDKGRETLNAGHAIMRAFIRNSVVNRTPQGEPEQVAHFNRTLDLMREDHVDGDIIDKFEAARKKLEEAVRVETNGTFAMRIAAYNEVKTTLEWARETQQKRDATRLVQIKAGTRKVPKATEPGNNQNQRIAMIAQRVEQASEIRGLI